MNIIIPEDVQQILTKLENNGYNAYVVGGCVRDSVLGREPNDWDICTSALPKQTLECFEGYHIIETGLKHGTVTVVVNHQPFEVTTFRCDGIYSDNRHPDKVEFVDNLKEDLSRRDFTVNSMAYNPKCGVVDYFGGIDDIKSKIVRCVGNANKRFEEDALRIMRVLRFASVLDFTVEKNTVIAMFNNKGLLKNIAVERIADELNKLIVGDTAGDVLLKHLPVITEVIPELIPTIGFNQNNQYHCFDVLNHTLASIDNAPKNVVLRLTMLFHDIAKPLCYTDDSGCGHFYGHPQISSDIANDVLKRLKYDSNTIGMVTQLVLYHDAEIQPHRKHIKRWLNKIGDIRFRQLIEVKKAEVKAQSDIYKTRRLLLLEDVLVMLDEIIQQQQCFSLKDLAVNGHDLIDVGVPKGVVIGRVLNQLLDMVVEEKLENNREELLRLVSKIYIKEC